jgi:hypothetical protein
MADKQVLGISSSYYTQIVYPVLAPALYSFQNRHTFPIQMKSGTSGSFVLVRWSCSNNEHVLMKPAIEKTLIEAVVSFLMLIECCDMW